MSGHKRSWSKQLGMCYCICSYRYFANKICKASRGMAQLCLTSVWNNIELWKDIHRLILNWTFASVLDWKVLLLHHSEVDSGIRFFPHWRHINPSILISWNRHILHFLSLIINLYEIWTEIFSVWWNLPSDHFFCSFLQVSLDWGPLKIWKSL
jgi:hypothetical protein